MTQPIASSRIVVSLFGRSICALTIFTLAFISAGTLFAGPGPFTEHKDLTPPPNCSWTGFYLGFQVGYGWGDSESSSNDEGFGTDGDPQSLSLDPNGAVIGGQLGYNWQLNEWFVLGVEASGGWLDLSDSKFLDSEPPDNFATADLDWYITITPRIGFSFWNNRALFYLKGGVAFAEVENRAGDLDEGEIDPHESTSSDDTEVGWTIGAGVEAALNCAWSVGVEYNYFGGLDHSSSNFNEDIPATQHYQHDNDAHLVTARVNYRFWGVNKTMATTIHTVDHTNAEY